MRGISTCHIASRGSRADHRAPIYLFMVSEVQKDGPLLFFKLFFLFYFAKTSPRRVVFQRRFCTSGRRLVPAKAGATSRLTDLIFYWSGQCVENNSFMGGNALFTGYGENGNKRRSPSGAKADVCEICWSKEGRCAVSAIHDLFFIIMRYNR